VRPESREDEPLGCGLGRRRLNEQAQCFRLSKDHLYERSVMSDIQCLSCSKLDQEHGTTFGSCERCGHRSCRLHLVSASIRGSTDGYSVNVSASVDDPPRIKLFDPRLRAAIAELCSLGLMLESVSVIGIRVGHKPATGVFEHSGKLIAPIWNGTPGGIVCAHCRYEFVVESIRDDTETIRQFQAKYKADLSQALESADCATVGAVLRRGPDEVYQATQTGWFFSEINRNHNYWYAKLDILPLILRAHKLMYSEIGSDVGGHFADRGTTRYSMGRLASAFKPSRRSGVPDVVASSESVYITDDQPWGFTSDGSMFVRSPPFQGNYIDKKKLFLKADTRIAWPVGTTPSAKIVAFRQRRPHRYHWEGNFYRIGDNEVEPDLYDRQSGYWIRPT
jgi:hypothetical protein